MKVVREDLRKAIVGEIELFLAEEGLESDQITPASDLLDVGIDSLGFAVLVARLEEQLQVDPFLSASEVAFPRTVEELVNLYEAALR